MFRKQHIILVNDTGLPSIDVSIFTQKFKLQDAYVFEQLNHINLVPVLKYESRGGVQKGFSATDSIFKAGTNMI